MPFIALEGGEGVGKSTQLQLLQKRLPPLFPDRQFIFTREPGGTEFAEAIRGLILSNDAEHADGKTIFSLFAAARFDHVAQLIRPKLEAGDVVITDRFFASSYAYQVVAQENAVSETFFTAYLEELNLFPHLTIVLSMDPVSSQARVRARHGDPENHFDSRAMEFHQKLHDGYRRFGHLYRDRNVVFIDADRSVEEVQHDIVELITKTII